jgi:hypothetical protein
MLVLATARMGLSDFNAKLARYKSEDFESKSSWEIGKEMKIYISLV